MKLNYFNLKKIDDKYLIINELGLFAYLSEENLKSLVDERYDKLPDSILKELEEKFFIYDCDDEVFVEKVKKKDGFNKNKINNYYQIFIYIF